MSKRELKAVRKKALVKARKKLAQMRKNGWKPPTKEDDGITEIAPWPKHTLMKPKATKGGDLIFDAMSLIRERVRKLVRQEVEKAIKEMV